MDKEKVTAYLARHRVEELVNEAVNDAVRTEAPDPIAHIAQYLARLSGLCQPADVQDLEEEQPNDQLRLAQLTEEEARIAEVLISCGQQKIWADWPLDPADAAEKRSFFAMASALDGAYPGGLHAYIDRGKELLAKAARGENTFDGWRPSAPDPGYVLSPDSEDFIRYEAAGIAELRRVAFVIPAGGTGDRLGFSGVKFALPAEITTGAKVLEVYAQYILAFERLANMNGGEPVTIPLAFMVSESTRSGIEELLRDHDNFGLKPAQITLLQQERVAAFSDVHGHLAMKGRYQLEAKPHGHGDVHFLLHTSNLAQRWLSEGRKWIVFFQDTNTLYLSTLLATLGVSAMHGLDMNSVCVPRKAKEAVGAMCKLTHPDKRPVLASVEYNQLDPLLRATKAGADENDPSSGMSPYPGNINELVLRLPAYVAALANSGGKLPEFINPKFTTGASHRATTFAPPSGLPNCPPPPPRAQW